MCEVAACGPSGSILGQFYGDMEWERTEWEGEKGSLLCELIEEDVFVSLDTFLYIKELMQKRSIKLECMCRGVLLSC